ncbi:MFS transporter [Beauveria brongniartii RCEF 3172]|uniref:MFS transporter n=1 Tax=Beauveria brongniartii RCEF 3172 TaxID=1081107 RepID=A0A167GJF1_9HYPO|nr:MFS transporter [Beauveria brongniartii RCEF 3172]
MSQVEKGAQVSDSPLSRDEIRAEERLSDLLREHGATWDSSLDSQDPYNWSNWAKAFITLILSLGQLTTLMSASMMAAALPQIGSGLHLSSFVLQITFSIYILGLAFAPFLIAALSEMYGRRPIWIASNLFYVFWNAMCPVGPSDSRPLFGWIWRKCRPILADMYRPEERGRSIAIATFLPYMGPALGPIVGGVTSQNLQWKWLFWILSIFDAAVVLVAYFFLRETYTPVLLRTKAARLRQTASDAPEADSTTNKLNKFNGRAWYTDLRMRLGPAIARPLALMVYRPAIQVIAGVVALNFAVYCLLLSTYATIWIDRYHQSETISSLNYIALAVGAIVASQAGGPLMDYIYRRMKARNGGDAVPEFRVPFMIPGVIMMPVGIFLYGWAAEKKLHWMVVDLGTAIFVCGSANLSQGMAAYMLDEFKHTASANAAARVLSNILGFVFPIFAPAVYKSLGYGWGNTLLGFIWVVCGFPIPVLLWIYGPRLRALGRKE